MTQGWEGILDPDEEIIWQGRPDGKITLRPGNIAMFVFGVFFAGFALFWMILASSAGGFFWAFGLLHFSAGAGLAWSALFWNAFKRRRSWYTLTNRRAFIAVELPMVGRKLSSYPITSTMMLELDSNEPASIYFAEEMKRGNNGRRTVKIGFERIENGRDVYAKIREVQKTAP